MMMMMLLMMMLMMISVMIIMMLTMTMMMRASGHTQEATAIDHCERRRGQHAQQHGLSRDAQFIQEEIGSLYLLALIRRDAARRLRSVQPGVLLAAELRDVLLLRSHNLHTVIPEIFIAFPPISFSPSLPSCHSARRSGREQFTCRRLLDEP